MEILHEGKWVELHFSSLLEGPKDPAPLERLALGVARSLRVARTK